MFQTQKGGSNFDRAQTVKEGYLETSLPLIQDQMFTHLLAVTGSFRWSKYNSSPKTFTTWAIGGNYAPVSDITFRVSYNKASRQPTVYEQDSNVYSFVGGSGDPCAGATPSASLAQCTRTGVTAAEYGNIQQCLANSCLARSGGSQIQPETAHTLTYGAVLKPRFIPGLTFSVDRFDIEVDDQISYAYDSDFMNGCLQFGIPFYCSHVVRNPNGSLTSASAYAVGTTPATGYVIYGSFNAYKYLSNGFDFQAQYTVPVAPINGTLNFNFNGTLTTERGGKDDPTFTASRNNAGYFGPFAGIPRPKWVQGLRTTYTTDSKFMSTSLNWRYIGGTTATQDSGDPLIGGTPGQQPLTLFNKIPAYNYIDLNVTFKLTSRYTLSLVANNLLDKMPPILPNSYDQYQSRANTITKTYDVLGRFLQVSVTANF